MNERVRERDLGPIVQDTKDEFDVARPGDEKRVAKYPGFSPSIIGYCSCMFRKIERNEPFQENRKPKSKCQSIGS